MRDLFFSRPADETCTLIGAALQEAGFRVETTFDLKTALALLPDCPCPHHGTALCDCQYIVLIAHPSNGRQETLVIHGHDGRSWVVLIERPDRHPDPRLEEALLLLLLPQGFTARHRAPCHDGERQSG